MKLPVTPCPNCGNKAWSYPDVKGQYGYKDTNKATCRKCWKTYRISTMKEVKP